MKQTLFFIFISISTFIWAQNNDIENQILKYEDSKSTIISKGRNLLIDKFLENDLQKVSEVRKYLMEEVEDNNYIVLYPIENWFILYWTNEYNELLRNINSFGSTHIAGSSKRIHPNKDMLGLHLKEKSIKFEDAIMEQIRDSKLSLEQKDFLLLVFQYLVTDTTYIEDYRDWLNNQADTFLNNYPNSEYNDFIREHIRYKLVPKDWGVAFEVFSGYSLFTEMLQKNYTNNVPIGVAFDVCYKKFELYLRDYIGFNKTKKDFNYSLGVFEKGNRTMVFLPEASFGYAVVDNNRLKISPFIGIGAMDIAPSLKDREDIPELKEVSLDFTTTYTLGFNFDIKLGKKDTPAFSPKTNYGFIRIRYAYSIPRFEKKYDGMTGNMHYITIGIGVFARGVKREY